MRIDALPDAARERLEQYVTLLFKWQRVMNLTGAETPEIFRHRHLADCLSVLPFLGTGSVADIGSGAGLPGLVLACAEPDRPVTLVEPRQKRARFLRQAAIELGLTAVAVEAVRAERWTPMRSPDVLITRALSSLAGFAAVTRHLRKPGQRLLAMKGRDPHEEIDALPAGVFEIDVRTLTVEGWSDRHLVVLRVRDQDT